MIRVLFFAKVRDQLGISEIDVTCDENRNVQQLLTNLQGKGDLWKTALGQNNLLVAVNQVMSRPSQTLESGDEVAFFPPVTGG